MKVVGGAQNLGELVFKLNVIYAYMPVGVPDFVNVSLILPGEITNSRFSLEFIHTSR